MICGSYQSSSKKWLEYEITVLKMSKLILLRFQINCYNIYMNNFTNNIKLTSY
jgi:hypothetical protein